MAIYKNKASQKLAVFAYDSTDGSAKTGDAANITAQISLDGAATAATNDVNPTELDATDAPGVYLFDLTQDESNADLVIVAAVSSTDDILIEPVIVYTQPEIRQANTVQIEGADATDTINAQVDQALSDYDSPTNAEMEARTLPSADYFDPAADTVTTDTDSRNASKADVSGLSTLDAAGVRTAVGLESADLDAQLDGITAPTVEEIDAELTANHGAGLWGAASESSIIHTYTVLDSSNNPIDGALVECSTDSAKANVIQSAYTNASGIATFYLDAGTYYFWTTRSGYNFTNPDSEVVA